MKCDRCSVTESSSWIGLKVGKPICIKCYRKEWYLGNKKKHKKNVRKWEMENPDSAKKRSKKWRDSNPEKSASWAKENPTKKAKINRKSYLKNINKVKNRTALYQKVRRLEDINFRLADNLRSRLRKAIKNNQKAGSAVDDLGCSVDDLKIHLEGKFSEGMSWDNYGEWHIDHIRPLSRFDLTNKSQHLEACSYNNLQPLWAIDNLKKSNKV